MKWMEQSKFRLTQKGIFKFSIIVIGRKFYLICGTILVQPKHIFVETGEVRQSILEAFEVRMNFPKKPFDFLYLELYKPK